MTTSEPGVSVYDGKYTIRRDGDGRMHCLRYNEPWRDLTGDGMVLALVQEIQKLRDEVTSLKSGTISFSDDLREIESLKKDLARVTAERDEALCATAFERVTVSELRADLACVMADRHRLDWLSESCADVFEEHGEWYVGTAAPAKTLRAALDSVRKGTHD